MKTNRLMTFCFLGSIVSFCLLLCACGIASVDATFTAAEAIMAGVGVVLATVGTLLSPVESAAIQAAVGIVSGAIAALKTGVDNFEADKTGTGLEADINAALAALKQSLPQLVAAAQIKNPTLQAWITSVTNLIGTVVTEVETDIVPQLSAVKAAYLAGDSAPAEKLGDQFKTVVTKLKADYEASLQSSGLPAEAIAAAKTDFEHKNARHIGPIRV